MICLYGTLWEASYLHAEETENLVAAPPQSECLGHPTMTLKKAWVIAREFPVL